MPLKPIPDLRQAFGGTDTPILGFAAFSGTGKTTLLRRLIPILVGKGLRIGLIKHSHHAFEIDQPGKDSYELRQAGASTVMLSSTNRRAMIRELIPPTEPSLAEELRSFDQTGLDLILVEGFKRERFPKIELHRPALGKPLLYPQDDTIIAIATDDELLPLPPITQLDLNDPDRIANFVLERCGRNRWQAAFDHCNSEPAKLLPLDLVLRKMSEVIQPVEAVEWVNLKQALGRILAEDVRASLDLPPFSNSSMDGYAVRAEDIARFEALKVVGTAWAGKSFGSPIAVGECVRIFTGAAAPVGADAVVMQERVTCHGDTITVRDPIEAGENVRQRGSEIKSGATLLNRGKRVMPADLGLLASQGHADVLVRRKVRVAFLCTGDELRGVGQTLQEGQIYDSNRYVMHALLQQAGVNAIDLGVVADEPASIRSLILEAAAIADAVITSGGVSLGEADFVTRTLAEVGQVHFWKVAIKPGKPFVFGRVGPAYFFGLPGNPVAVMATFYQIVRPALRWMMGAPNPDPIRLQAICGNRLVKARGRLEFQRGFYRTDETGDLRVVGFSGQGSHLLTEMSRANCFIVLPAESEGAEIGDRVEIQPLEFLTH